MRTFAQMHDMWLTPPEDPEHKDLCPCNEDFEFNMMKLGFTEEQVNLPDQTDCWCGDPRDPEAILDDLIDEALEDARMDREAENETE